MASYFRLIDAGRNEEAVSVFRQNAAQIPRWRYPLYYMLAGKQSTALNELEDLANEGEPNIEFALREKAFDHLADDPRFVHLLERMNVAWRYGLEPMQR